MALETARGDLRIQDAPEPHEEADGWVDSIANLQRRRDVEGIADGRDDQGLCAEAPDRVDPEGQEAADPGVLQHEGRTVAELVLENCLSVPAKLAGRGRLVPRWIECHPVIPRRARRL